VEPSHAMGGTFTPANYTIQYVNGALTVTSLVIVPPVEPPVLPPVEPPVEPSVQPLTQGPLLDVEQGTSTASVLVTKPVWLTIAPLLRVTQGPVTFPANPIPIAAPAVPLPAPIPEIVQDKKEVTAPPVPVLPAVPFLPTRPLKQDRN